MLSIGEFSRVTGLTVKTLRFYHQQGVLVPSRVDGKSGYRYYAENKIDTARVIAQLRELDFPLSEIREILSESEDDEDILEQLTHQKNSIREKVGRYRDILHALDNILSREKEAKRTMSDATYQVEEKTIDAVLIAGIRMKARYDECGTAFGRIGRYYGRQINGKAMLLHYDGEYKEDDADFEACMPIRKGEGTEGVDVRELPGGRCVSLLHKGPYGELRRSYEKAFKYVNAQGYEVILPTREVYIKGPGMIFKGNPKKYLTEIQLFIRE